MRPSEWSSQEILVTNLNLFDKAVLKQSELADSGASIGSIPEFAVSIGDKFVYCGAA
jgi:hypothetical protein